MEMELCLWESHCAQHLISVLAGVCSPAHPSWHPLGRRDCAKGFCIPEKRGLKHKAASVWREYPQISGVQKACRVTASSFPPPVLVQ